MCCTHKSREDLRKSEKGPVDRCILTHSDQKSSKSGPFSGLQYTTWVEKIRKIRAKNLFGFFVLCFATRNSKNEKKLSTKKSLPPPDFL